MWVWYDIEEDLHNPNRSINICKQIKEEGMGGTHSTREKEEKRIQNSGQKTWREKSRTRYRHNLEDNIKMYYKEKECMGMNWLIRLRTETSGRLLRISK
jgi:intein/homing endonuclease